VKYFLVFMVLMIPIVSYSEEVCIDQKEYEKALEGVKALIAPQYQFEGYLSNLEHLMPVRKHLDPFAKQEVIEYIDSITDSTLSILNSSLGFMDPSDFHEKYKQRILNLAEQIHESRKEMPSTYSYDSLNTLLTSLGYNNLMRPTAKASAD
jgi:hypothetical protein